MATATATITESSTTTVIAATAAASTTTSTTQHHSIKLLHGGGGMPHGLGLLTTVASLPPKYRSRYLSINTKCETPLDLSVKPFSPQIASDVPIATSFAEVYTEPSTETEMQNHTDDEYTTLTTLTSAPYELQTISLGKTVVLTTEPTATTNVHDTIANITTTNTVDITKSPMTPPPTPTKRKLNEQSLNFDSGSLIEPETIVERIIAERYTNPSKMAKTNEQPTIKRETTPIKPIRPSDTAPKTVKSQQIAPKSQKNKATRKLKFDEETSSPVSGTIIRPLEDITDGTVQYSNGDIDPKYNIVEITEETKAELAAIKNVIGDYICKLCRIKFDDAFGLAQHRCACIVLLEYRCPECGKQFNCPANLASHRRWHKPKKDACNVGGSAGAKKENRNTTNLAIFSSDVTQSKRTETMSVAAASYECDDCGKKFKRQAYLRKHQLTHVNEGKKALTKSTGGILTTRGVTATGTGIGTTTTKVKNTRAGKNITSVSNDIVYHSYGSSSGASISSSSSSVHSYSGGSTMNEDEVGAVYVINDRDRTRTRHHSSEPDVDGDGNGDHDIDGDANTTSSVHGIASGDNNYDYDIDSMSECSNSSVGYGRLQIVESGLTEEENIAAAALTNLRNCASVIQHTTLAH